MISQRGFGNLLHLLGLFGVISFSYDQKSQKLKFSYLKLAFALLGFTVTVLAFGMGFKDGYIGASNFNKIPTLKTSLIFMDSVTSQLGFILIVITSLFGYKRQIKFFNSLAKIDDQLKRFFKHDVDIWIPIRTTIILIMCAVLFNTCYFWIGYVAYTSREFVYYSLLAWKEVVILTVITFFLFSVSNISIRLDTISVLMNSLIAKKHAESRRNENMLVKKRSSHDKHLNSKILIYLSLKLMDLIEKINKIFGFPLLTMITYDVITMTNNIYRLFNAGFLKGSDSGMMLVNLVSELMPTFANLIFIVLWTTEMKRKAERFQKIVSDNVDQDGNDDHCDVRNIIIYGCFKVIKVRR